MRKSMVLAVFLVLVLGVAAPAWAQQDGQRGEASEAFVVLSGRADVPRGQTVGDLVVGLGALAVAIWRARSASQATAAPTQA